ncbi:MAG: phosphatidate cytidylyltransferase [Proteobacteria bacterium]|nr:phosphatidate cytidylyltransferase [Pseudomonadota bacterium]
MSDGLRKRIVTAVVLGVALLVVLLGLPPLYSVALVSVLVLAGAWEWSGFLKVGTAARAAYVGLIALLMWAAWGVAASGRGRNLLIMIAVAWWLVALAWVALAPRRTSSLGAALAGVLALVPAWLALMCLRLSVDHGAEWVVFTLILVFAADIGAYFGGRHFGRVKLAPRVSPNKTWEGVLGGMLLSSAWAFGGSLWFHLPWLTFVPLCIAAVAFSIVGDLTESMLKRFAGLKDSGALLPGHGGMMDRIDSITAAAPVLFFGLTLMGVVP